MNKMIETESNSIISNVDNLANDSGTVITKTQTETETETENKKIVTKTDSKSYLEIAKDIIAVEGLGGLFGRGLQVRNIIDFIILLFFCSFYFHYPCFCFFFNYLLLFIFIPRVFFFHTYIFLPILLLSTISLSFSSSFSILYFTFHFLFDSHLYLFFILSFSLFFFYSFILQTRVLSNALQAMLFSVLFKYFSSASK